MTTRGKARVLGACVAASAVWLAGARAAEKGGIPADQLGTLHRLVRPQPGESKWAAVPWLTDLAEARRRSAAEDRPLFVWRAGGGEVLGRA